jgi:hypothetical protein
MNDLGGIVHSEIPPVPDRKTTTTARQSLPRGVRNVHLLTLAAAGIYLVYLATKRSFFLDEWDFLAYRGVHLAGSGLFVPHNEHWTTIPILIWRGLFNVVGVRHYWLYALPMVVAHLAVVALLWRFMLRHNVEPWVATLLAAAFAVLGAGSENITSAFQITFVGSVAFGLLAIEAVEHDRLWLPALWGIAALMCSNIGVPMVLGCVLVALARRRLAAAAAAAIPPALIFLIWYVLIGHIGTYTSTDIASLSLSGMVSYVWIGLTTSMSGLVDGSPHVSSVFVNVFGALLVIVLASAGVARRNVPAALALTTLPFYVFVGLGRLQYGTGQAASSRYSYIAIAFCLPLIGQLITTLVRRRAVRTVVVFGLAVLVGTNAVVLKDHADLVAAGRSIETSQIQAAAYLIHQGATFPGQRTSSDPIGPPDMPIVAALTSLVRLGQFPVPKEVAPPELRAERAILGVFASPKRGYPGALTITGLVGTTCTKVSTARFVTLQLTVSGSVRLEIPHPMVYTTVTVTFPGVQGASGTLVVVPTSGYKWLNVPAEAYPTALVSASAPIRVCNAVDSSSGR